MRGDAPRRSLRPNHRLAAVGATLWATFFTVPALARLGPDLDARLAERVRASEYHARETARGLQAPDRAHGLRTWFAPDGIRVHARTAGAEADLLSLALAGLGRGDVLAAVAPGAVSSDGARVEIRPVAGTPEGIDMTPLLGRGLGNRSCSS